MVKILQHMKTKVNNENLVITKNQFKMLFLKIGHVPIHQDLNCHIGRKIKKIKLQMNEHKIFLQQA